MTSDKITEISAKNPIIFYDGLCVFCTWSIRFVLKHDKQKRFRLCPLQSELAESIASQVTRDEDYQTVVALYQGQMYQKSDVTFFIVDELGGLWRTLLIFKIFPKFLRDAVYSLIARYRYRLFGKRQACYLPTPEERFRFLGFPIKPDSI